MALQLSVSTTEGEKVTTQDYLFREDRVTIGRGRKNHLMLPASWVRPTHAIVDRAWGRYRLILSGWDEITSLNGESIINEQPCPLQEGDVLRVGSFRMEIQLPNLESKSSGEDDRTKENPFDAPVRDLFNALKCISNTYEGTLASSRDRDLEAALAPRSISPHVAVRKTLDGLWEGRRMPGSEHSSETETTTFDEEQLPVDRVQSDRHLNGTSDVLEVLSFALARTLEVPAQFRCEFIGHTLTHPPEARFLYEGSGAKIKKHLTDSSASYQRQRKCLQYVEEAAESVARHQVATIKGYKASVITGVKELLQRLDPDAHRQDILEQNALFEHVPILTSARVLDRVQEECRDLLEDDWSVAEQRVFRPAFAKAYLSHITSPHTQDKDDARSTARS